MKRIFFTLMFVPLFTASQVYLDQAPGKYVDLSNHHLSSEGNRDIIWAENFSNGIPSGWENSEAGGTAFWEYRGPATNPNSEVGTRGSCLPAGVLGDPIMSPSASSGFVIFDSNWWDNPDQPCIPENFGTGPVPGPHVAILTTPSIDLSSHPGVALEFNQYLKIYEGQTRVEVSVGGGNWQTVFVNPSLPNPTTQDAVQFVQLSLYAGGQSDVRIRFVFDGLYYFWMLDDIRIVEAYGNDLSINATDYGDFNLSDPAHPTGFEFMEYSKYPDEMAPLLKFSALVENRGVVTQSDSRLQVQVLDFNSNVIHSAQSDEGVVIPVGDALELRAGSFQMPAVEDNYRIAFSTTSQFQDDNPTNNLDTAYFHIHDVQYARDHFFANALYLATPDLESQPYEIGNVFLVTADNMSVYSISVGVGIGSSASTSIYGKLYSFDISESLDATWIATTNTVEITPEMMNSGGEQIMTNLTFPAPVAVESGTAYFVSVGCNEGTSLFVCALSGDAYEYTSFVRFNETDWFTVDRIPMVRMNFGFYDEVSESTPRPSSLHVFPNPAGESVYLDVSEYLHQDLSISLTDHLGQLIQSRVIKQNESGYVSIDLSQMASGVYHLHVVMNNQVFHQNIVRR